MHWEQGELWMVFEEFVSQLRLERLLLHRLTRLLDRQREDSVVPAGTWDACKGDVGALCQQFVEKASLLQGLNADA